MGQATEVVAKAWQLFERGRYDQLDEVFAADCEFRMPGGVSLTGPDQIGPYVKAWFDAFPDLQHRIVTAVEADGVVATELAITGTHTRPMASPKGMVPATGRRIAFESCDCIRVRDGRVSQWHAYFDQLAFLGQLGLVPE